MVRLFEVLQDIHWKCSSFNCSFLYWYCNNLLGFTEKVLFFHHGATDNKLLALNLAIIFLKPCGVVGSYYIPLRELLPLKDTFAKHVVHCYRVHDNIWRVKHHLAWSVILLICNNDNSDKQAHFYLKNQRVCKAHLHKFSFLLPTVIQLQVIVILQNLSNSFILEMIKKVLNRYIHVLGSYSWLNHKLGVPEKKISGLRTLFRVNWDLRCPDS